MYDYYVDPKKLDWELWEPKVPPFRYLKTMPFHKMIVPTVDTVRNLYITRLHMDHGSSHLAGQGRVDAAREPVHLSCELAESPSQNPFCPRTMQALRKSCVR